MPGSLLSYFGKSSYIYGGPTTFYNGVEGRRFGLAFNMPDYSAFGIVSVALQVTVTAYGNSLESWTPTIYVAASDQHTFPTNWMYHGDYNAGSIAGSTTTQSCALDLSVMSRFNNQYITMILANDKEVGGTGSGGSGSLQSAMNIDPLLANIKLVYTLQP
jgi:hypothetical protein